MPLVKEGLNVPTTVSNVLLGETSKPFAGCIEDLSHIVFAAVAELSVDQAGVIIQLPLLRFSLKGQELKEDEVILEGPWIKGEAMQVRDFYDGKVRVDTPLRTKLYGMTPKDLDDISRFEGDTQTRFPLTEINIDESPSANFIRGVNPTLLKIGEAADLAVQVFSLPSVTIR